MRGVRGKIALALVAIAVVFPASASADWVNLNGALNADQTPSATNEDATDIVGVDNAPWATWSEWSPANSTYQVRVASWNGSSWVQRGGILNATANRLADQPAIANVGGVAHVVWREWDALGTPHIRVSRWNAGSSAWEALGSTLDTGRGDVPDITGIGGVPYVVWGNTDGTEGTLRVHRWNGSSWITVGTPLTTNDNIGKPSITAVGTVPYVAWSELSSGAQSLRVAQFNGTTWQTLTSPAHAGTTESLYPSIADVGGVPTLAWIERLSGQLELRVAQRSGGSWTDLGGAVTPSPVNFTTSPSLTDVGGDPYVAWATGLAATNGKINVATWDGSAWTAVGSALSRSGTTDARWPAIASIAADAYVIWDETPESLSADYDVYVSTFDIGTPAPMPPDTTITNDSIGTASPIASYSFTATPAAGATFECSYDGEDFVPCTSPHQSGILAEGNHTFRVRATNSEGTDPTPALRAFVVDSKAPSVALDVTGIRTSTGAYAGSARVDATATDPFISSGIRSKFCVVDPPSPPSTLSAFGSRLCGFDVTAPGNHTVYAIANDNASNESTIVSATFRVVPPPDTTILSGPSGVASSAPVFTFNSDDPNANFQCSVDSGPFQGCTSPLTAYNLALGDHVLSVRAVSLEGVTDPTPATRAFTTGERKVKKACSFDVPWFVPTQDNKNPPSPSDYGCKLLADTCPLRSVCTAKMGVDAVDDDVRASVHGTVDLNYGQPRPSFEFDCNSNTSFLPQGADKCPAVYSRTIIGAGQKVTADCAVDYNSSFDPVRGPDDRRQVFCEVIYTVVPATNLAAGAAGTGLTVLLPGAGEVTLTPGAGGRQRLAALAAKKAPFKPITKAVTEEGPVTLKPKLNPKLKRKLKKKEQLKLSVSISFTSVSGDTQTSSQTVLLTQPCTKKKGC